jgi:dCMP deaminase
MRPGFDLWALDLAFAVSDRSRDPSTKVGAVIIRHDKTIASMGYNGFPRTMEDKEEWWNDRPEKYARVIHAEMNALLNAKESVLGMTLYVTHPCCEHCAKHVIAAGITKVVFATSDEIRERFDIAKSLELFSDCGVQVTEVEL